MTDYRTVPVDPTEEMLHAADMKAMFTRGESDMPRALWSAMLAAAPAITASPAPALGDLVERVRQLADWLAEGDPGGAGSVLLSGSVAQDHAADLRAAVDAMQPGWRDMESAPKDGTPILAWCVHPHARYAGDDKEWAAPVVTQWITHNGGGWTWNGMAGSFTHWQPLPAAPGVGS